MQSAKVEVQAYAGRKKEVEKLQIHAEMDQKGNVFVKAAGVTQEEQFAIFLEYDKEKAIEEFTKLVKMVLEKQIEELKK